MIGRIRKCIYQATKANDKGRALRWLGLAIRYRKQRLKLLQSELKAIKKDCDTLNDLGKIISNFLDEI
jgi:hypothetical protein